MRTDSWLEHIDCPADLKKVPDEALNGLCAEIRDFLIKSVSKTGGHLASNLGAVELTVAIHRVLTARRMISCSMWAISAMCIRCSPDERGSSPPYDSMAVSAGFCAPLKAPVTARLPATHLPLYRLRWEWPGPKCFPERTAPPSVSSVTAH